MGEGGNLAGPYRIAYVLLWGSQKGKGGGGGHSEVEDKMLSFHPSVWWSQMMETERSQNFGK